MKNILIALSFWLILSALLYLGVGFYSLDLNPFEWSESARFLFAFCFCSAFPIIAVWFYFGLEMGVFKFKNSN